MTELTRENLKEELLDYSGVALVDFYTPSCGECAALYPVLEEIEKKTPNIKFCKVNCFNNEKFAASFGVLCVPTLVLYKNGRVVDCEIGMMEEDAVLSLIALGFE